MTDRRAMSAKARFLQTFERESATTRKVLQAFPADQASLKPHERSKPAIELAWIFVLESQIMTRGLKGEPLFPASGGAPKPPEAWSELVDAFDAGTAGLVAQLRDETNAELEGNVPWFLGPKQPGDIPLADFMWFMLHDHIHHRGQLSVYLRMAGGKVPSIYGPTADEPWR
jgi:uncharacterized damage-inducible protein DinB